MDDLINFGVKHSVDFIAASFVRKASDVWEIRRVLEAAAKANPAPDAAIDNEYGYVTPTGIRVVAKVENQEGLNNFDEILDASDGIMVARGDLGMEIPLEKARRDGPPRPCWKTPAAAPARFVAGRCQHGKPQPPICLVSDLSPAPPARIFSVYSPYILRRCSGSRRA